jgi:hypothetical protein
MKVADCRGANEAFDLDGNFLCLPDLQVRAQGAVLGIVVFASEYRPAPETVHRKHADMCFSRTGVSRVGTAEPLYEPDRRGFLPFVSTDSHAFRALPQVLRDKLWQVPPETLAATRMAPNLQLLNVGFRAEDQTVSAIVSLPFLSSPQQRPLDVPITNRHAYLPDAAAGIFARPA